MISYVVGNLFESPAQTLVNTVNTQGVMGKGIAKEFKAIFPNMFEAYQNVCEAGELDIGNLFLYRTPNKLILNFPTKRSWRLPSRKEYIEAGLQRFAEMYAEAGITSIAFPPLGCGNGELDFEAVVRPLLEKYLGELPIPVYIYAPIKTVDPVEHRNQKEIRQWLRQTPKTLPFSEVWEDIVELVAKRPDYRTLTDDTPFRAEISGHMLHVREGEMTRVFQADEIQELWRELRDHLVITRYGLAERERDISYLFSILSALPYIECTTTGATLRDLVEKPELALYLIPRTDAVQSQQRELTFA